jgi:hypothetical protein
MLLNFVMATMFIVLPTFWVMALGWAGVRAGNSLGGLITGTSDAKSAGGSGSRLAMTAVSKGARSKEHLSRDAAATARRDRPCRSASHLVVQADARVSVSKFRLLLVVLVGVPREPCGDHRKGQQQDEPDTV